MMRVRVCLSMVTLVFTIIGSVINRTVFRFSKINYRSEKKVDGSSTLFNYLHQLTDHLLLLLLLLFGKNIHFDDRRLIDLDSGIRTRFLLLSSASSSFLCPFSSLHSLYVCPEKSRKIDLFVQLFFCLNWINHSTTFRWNPSMGIWNTINSIWWITKMKLADVMPRSD